MAIHQRPALKIIELVPSFSELRNAVLSTISKDHLLTHQVHYAVLDDDRSNNPDIDKVGDVFGQPLLLRDVDVRFPAGIAPADLFLIPSSISDNLKDGLHDILARVSRMARPDAVLIIVAIASTIEEIASPILKVRGFEIAFRLPTGVEEVVVYRNVSRDHDLGAGDLTNGTLVNGSTHSMEVCIIEPMSLSPDAQTVSQKLQDRLEDQGFSVVIKTGAADIDVFDCRMFISLLELEEPILKDLSEPPFQSIRRLVINSERLLWITCGDDPAFGIVDGLSRCVNNEVAGSKFQVLHLSSGGMQHAPNLALRILKSSTSSADNEFREQGWFASGPAYLQEHQKKIAKFGATLRIPSPWSVSTTTAHGSNLRSVSLVCWIVCTSYVRKVCSTCHLLSTSLNCKSELQVSIFGIS